LRIERRSIMKNFCVARVVALTAVVCLLLAFAMPAAAAPGSGAWTDSGWSPTSLVHWLQSLWTGWFGSDAEVPQNSGLGNVYDEAGAYNEPDGVRAASPSDGTTTLSLLSDGGF
jgi:hypothetical protein